MPSYFVQDLTTATSMLRDVYDLDPVPQESRYGGFGAMITRSDKFTADMHKKFIIQNVSRVQADSDAEADFPRAGGVKMLDVAIRRANLRRLSGTLKVSIPTETLVRGEDAAWDIFTELKANSLEALMQKRNRLAIGSASATIGTVNQIYATTGAAYNQAAGAFLQILDAPVNAFAMGQELTINSVKVRVTDIEFNDTFGDNKQVGPGIFITLSTEESSATHLDTVVATNAIIDTGDVAGFPMGLDTLCQRYSSGVLAYFDVTDRQALGYRFLMANGKNYDSAGGTASPVDLNVEVHFGTMANVMYKVFGDAQAGRRNRGFQFPSSVITVAPPDLIQDAAAQIGNASLRFTKQIYNSPEEAKKAGLVAYKGWTGVVLNDPTFQHPIVMQADPFAPPNKIRVTDPSAFEWIRVNGGTPEWVPGVHAGMWNPVYSTTTGIPTPFLVANFWTWETLFCEQPRAAAYSIEGVRAGMYQT